MGQQLKPCRLLRFTCMTASGWRSTGDFDRDVRMILAEARERSGSPAAKITNQRMGRADLKRTAGKRARTEQEPSAPRSWESRHWTLERPQDAVLVALIAWAAKLNGGPPYPEVRRLFRNGRSSEASLLPEQIDRVLLKQPPQDRESREVLRAIRDQLRKARQNDTAAFDGMNKEEDE